MRILSAAAVFAMVVLPSALAVAQPSPPSWECQTNRAGERSCRAIWDSRDKAPPPMIKGDQQK